MATSGTLGQFAASYTMRTVLDHAFRRAGLLPEQASGENLDIARELIGSVTSEWINAGYPLWTRQFQLFGPVIGNPDVVTTVGTVDIFHSFWRILQPYRGPATLSTGADGSPLFGGQPNPDIVIAGPNPAVAVDFGSATEIDTVGILLGGNAPLTAVLNLQTSADGITYTTAQALPSTTYTPGQWQYFGVIPSIMSQYLQVEYTNAGSLTLNQLNFGLANGVDIELGMLNQDQYYQLPDKQFQSDRPNSAFIDRQLNQPVLKAWPTPNVGAFYGGCYSMLTRRYIQDPGQLTNNVEVPQRWIEALQWRLAYYLAIELPEKEQQQQTYFSLMAKQQRLQLIDKNATKSEALMWGEERTRGPLVLTPGIGVYTR